MLHGSEARAIPARASAVYAVLADVERYPAWQSFIAGVAVRERDAQGRPALVDARLDAKATVIAATLRYAYEDDRGVSWTYEGGDVKDVTGSFALTADGGSTHVSFSVSVDPGFRLGLLLRGPVEDRVRRRVLDGTLDELTAALAS